MNTLVRTSVTFALALAGVAAHADITGLQFYDVMIVDQSDAGPPGDIHNINIQGGPFSYSDPYTVSTVGAAVVATQGSFGDAIVSNTSNLFQSNASFFGYAQASSPVNGFIKGEVVGSNQVNFNLTTPGTLSLTVYGTYGLSGTGSHAEGSYLYVDGNGLQNAAIDGTYTIALGVGNHTVFAESYIEAFADDFIGLGDYADSQMGSNFSISIASVPEPCTMLFSAVSLVAIAKRRYHRKQG